MRTLPELLKDAEDIHSLYNEASRLECTCYNNPDSVCKYCSKSSKADKMLTSFCEQISAGLADISINPDYHKSPEPK